MIGLDKRKQKYLKTLNEWESFLTKYTIEELQIQPSEDTWSLGQVYSHLLDGILSYFDFMIKRCVSSDKNHGERKLEAGLWVFQNDSFPDIKVKNGIKGYVPDQPNSKKEILNKIEMVIKWVNETAEYLSKNEDDASKGKSLHKRFGYLTALEWYALGEMHFRHHLRQKQRIDQFLVG